MKYERFTQWTDNGASLILDNPKNAEEARTQVMEKFKSACNKLAELEDKIEQGTLKEIPENAVVLTQEEWATVHEQFAQAMYQKEVNTRKETAEKFAERLKDEVLNFCGTVEENGYFERGKLGFCEDIDEICKELTEGFKCQE